MKCDKNCDGPFLWFSLFIRNQKEYLKILKNTARIENLTKNLIMQI